MQILRLAVELATLVAVVVLLFKISTLSRGVQKLMSTTNQGLVALQAGMAALVTAQAAVLADVTKLLANQQPGLQPGQVIVLQSDIDALTATVSGMTAADVAADLQVNPPAPPAAPAAPAA